MFARGDSYVPLRIGDQVCLTGHVDDFDNRVAAVQFSLDGGTTWTEYPTEQARNDHGVTWSFRYTPEDIGVHLLVVRAVDGHGQPSPLSERFAFEVVP